MEETGGIASLSPRELEIAQAYSGGASYREIAERLYIAPTTVRTHLRTIYRKLGVSSKLGLLKELEPSSRRSGVESDHADQEPTEPQMPTLAVLSFRALSEDPDIRLIAAGLTEDLSILLARVPGFFVVSRDCARIVDTENLAASQVGAELSVRYIVIGTVQGRNNRARISAQLIDALTNRTLWTRGFEQAGYNDVLDLQTEIARAITQHIEPELARAEFSRIERRPFESLDAWELYHRAQGLLVLQGLSRDIVRQAFKLLHRSVEIDPNFALAHAQLAAIFAWCSTLSIDLGEPDLPERTLASLDRALALDRRHPTVLAFTGCALCDLRQHRRGLDLLKQAVELDPSNAIAQAGLGAGHLAMRETEEGIGRLREGIRLSPLDERVAFWRMLLARALYRKGQFDEAAEEAREACRRSDVVFASRVVLAVIELARGNPDDAAEAMKEARRIEPSLDAEAMRPVAGKQGLDLLQKAGLIA